MVHDSMFAQKSSDRNNAFFSAKKVNKIAFRRKIILSVIIGSLNHCITNWRSFEGLVHFAVMQFVSGYCTEVSDKVSSLTQFFAIFI